MQVLFPFRKHRAEQHCVDSANRRRLRATLAALRSHAIRQARWWALDSANMPFPNGRGRGACRIPMPGTGTARMTGALTRPVDADTAARDGLHLVGMTC
jgi:hypothetical protein